MAITEPCHLLVKNTDKSRRAGEYAAAFAMRYF